MSAHDSGPVAELAFMPWVLLGEPVTIGPVVFFDYPGETTPVTLSAADRAHLDRLKALYRTWPAQDEVPSIVIAAIDASAALRPLTEPERALVRRAGHALAFACLAHGYHAPFAGCSADNFLLFHQNFDGSPGIAVQTGRKLMGFSDAHLLRFVCAPWTPSELVPTRPNDDFVAPLVELIGRDDDANLRRLWLALESFFHALTDNEMSKGLWQLVHLNIAFEALLNFRDRKQFVSRVGRLCAPYCRRTERVALFADQGDRDYSLVQIWASDFYEIRNALVHGKPDAALPLFWRDVRSHSEIAVRVFRMCVRERLAKYVPAPEVLGRQPIRIVDSDFDGWALDERADAVLRRRAHQSRQAPRPPAP